MVVVVAVVADTFSNCFSQDIVKSYSNASGVYDSFKDSKLHGKVIDLCEGTALVPYDIMAKAAITAVLNLILPEPVESVKVGLEKVAAAPPEWKDVVDEAKEYLRRISESYPKLIKKSGFSDASSGAATVPTSNSTARFMSLKRAEIMPGVYRVALAAAFSEAQTIGLSTEDFEKSAKQIVSPANPEFDAAFRFVTRKMPGEAAPTQEAEVAPKATPLLTLFMDKVDDAVAVFNRTHRQFEGDHDDSISYNSNHDRLYEAATTALAKFCQKSDFSENQMNYIAAIMLQPSVRDY